VVSERRRDSYYRFCFRIVFLPFMDSRNCLQEKYGNYLVSLYMVIVSRYDLFYHKKLQRQQGSGYILSYHICIIHNGNLYIPFYQIIYSS